MTLQIVDVQPGVDAVLRTPTMGVRELTSSVDADHPLFLKVNVDGADTWVIAGQDRNHARELEELAIAFVGPSYGLVRRTTADGHLPQPVRGIGRHAVTVTVAASFEAAVEGRMLELARLIQDRPRRRGAIARSLQQVISDLRVAMAERDRQGAEHLLDELAERNDVTHSNLVFLRIQMLNRVGAHDEVLAHPELSRITGGQRPRDVTQALLESAAAVYLAELDYTDLEAWATQGTHVRRLLGPVATTVIPPRSVPEARGLVAAELSMPEPELERIEPVVRYLEGANERVAALIDQLQPPRLTGVEPELEQPESHVPETLRVSTGTEAPTAHLPRVLGLMNHRRFGDALAALQEAQPHVDLAWAAYNLHRELGTDESQRAFVRVTEPLRSILEEDAHNAQLIEAVDEISSGKNFVEDPAGWSEWLDRARAGASSPELVAMAERGAAGWEASTESAAALAQYIAQDFALTLRPAYGRLLERHEDALDAPGGLDLLIEVVEMVVTAGPTSQELAALPAWVETLVIADSRGTTARRLLEAIDALMQERPAPVLVNCVADLVGILSAHPLPGVDALPIAEEAASWTRRYGDVTDTAARLALAKALSDLGAPRPEGDPFWSATDEDNVLGRLRGLRVGIYTLMASVAARINDVLSSWVGDGVLEINEDKVATKSLTSLAERADIMFVVTGAATHAATDAIKAARGTRPLVQVHRKGFTALYTAVRDWTKQQVPR